MNWLDNIRRAELKRLLRRRGVSEIEVHNKVEDIISERIKWTATALGERVQLTFKEMVRCGIRTIAPVDMSKKMVRLYFRERKRERDRRRVNRMRARMQQVPKAISPRARQLANALDGEWTPCRDLADLMRKPWRLKRAALLSAVLRGSRELAAAGIAEEKIEAGPAGGRVLFLRLKRPMNVDVYERRMAGNTDEIGALRKGDSKMPSRQCRHGKIESPHRRSSTNPGTSGNGSLH